MTTELIEELQRRAARFAAVATVQQAISATISLDEVYREIYKAVASVVDALDGPRAPGSVTRVDQRSAAVQGSTGFTTA